MIEQIRNEFSLYAHELKLSELINTKNEVETEFKNRLSIINFYVCGNVTDARNEDHGESIREQK
ncbi:hypothetical protein [Psychroserpens damuponensis]|uniref:hypothetical protein n=1 Tax=Psychroserpens damuponensis TaxID=943936 RepID=UPI00058BA19B|nr:hypothetical protein [Psychroserpens damuponensis]